MYCRPVSPEPRLHEYAALELADRITQELDKGNVPFNIYLDLSKAFDTLDHNTMLYKLSYFGVKGIAINLFKNYLYNRTQYVEFRNNHSTFSTIKTGVPQGSILGPLPFIIYINDIIKASNVFKFIMYADDTTLFSTINCKRNVIRQYPAIFISSSN